MKVVCAEERIDPSALWYDLLNPTLEEREKLGKALNVFIPTPEEMVEIESSSRFYQELPFSYMTMNLIADAEGDKPSSLPMTMILSENHLITVRHTEFKSFETFSKVLQKNFHEGFSSEKLFLSLLEVIIDRVADIIEIIGKEIDEISQEIFKKKDRAITQQFVLKDILSRLGRKGDLSTKVRLSLGNIHRSLDFLSSQVLKKEQIEKHKEHLSILQQDVVSITDHISFVLHKTNFLLDATLGFINIEQNGIIKILSAAAVIFLPPMLITSIYGMNFVNMPELRSMLGYPLALFLMITSAILPYLYCKRKGWFQ